MRKRSVSLMAVALCLAMTLGTAGAAFADDAAGNLQAGTPASETSAASQTDTPAAATDPAATEAAAQADAAAAAAVEQHADGWEKDGAGWHYWKNGEMAKSRWVVTAAGPNIRGVTTKSHRYWIDKNGKLAVNRLVNPSKSKDAGAGYYAYAGKRGYVVTGKTVVGDKVYLAKKNGKLESGNSSGMLVTKKYDGEKHRYYIDPKLHAAVTGKTVKVKGFGWVYAYPKKGYLLTGLTKIDKTHLVLAEDNGKLVNKSGWVTTDTFTKGEKHRYYLERTKKNKALYGARIGSFKVDGKRYLSESQGYVFTDGYKLVDGKYYRADKSGALTYNGVITNMYKKAQGYSSPSQYLIMVDVNDTKFMVFTGKQGNWKTKYIWDCSTGHPSTPTPIGVWHVGIKGYSFGHGYTCYYYTQFNGDYLIHTRIYQEGTHILRDAAMNTQVSQGCVRLYDEDAYWVYKNIPGGTTVVTIP